MRVGGVDDGLARELGAEAFSISPYLPISPHISYGLACELGAEADAGQRVQRIEELDGAALGRGDVGEMSGRCSGDVGEMSGRYKGDAREMPVRCQ